ncbi:MAG TPA: hypothetical protein VLJ68_04205 [Chitinophagaceae bacterium]|nr:hypothetical protein [Chitinophagaceae bacterium]
MKKMILFLTLVVTVVAFTYCSHSKKATSSTNSTNTTTTTVAKVSYTNNIVPMIMNNCVPCHVPSKGGNKKAYDNYPNVKADIDEMIRRIELNPGDRGFMPFKHAKLSDSAINVFKQFKADGIVEN